MTTKRISDVEAFKKDSDKARNLPISEEQIKRINEIAREAELEENEMDETSLPKIAKRPDDSISAQI
ncbi:MAG: hypothetical protein COW01_00160 [Bdellovibrionales bacterium CG12_big_fil_rev_8_21_14_0_65_38_15]|nr:MAG: hypothetical protein COW79_14050 [Bdellovibrionales bacterium CG22_combo_CG10-13_8_21_14_all_38_13]PIQ57383.1 MAG: hypothetical protein COW01_00160 [Bdellovibrionales bacterium CG12_big_fil_rev_8_21_14_0_65_38_15]PIR31103.1 MAG: hypothetical protein COV38_01640 [Bdellovibrionales bacterium CG11_big_fil_rev_8_21_14_0_20_38_13]